MSERKKIAGQNYDEERALYALVSADVENCGFSGPADGESALKECRDVVVRNCRFSLRYPLWHTKEYQLIDSQMDELTRAPIWYARNGRIAGCDIRGIKCLRECDNTFIEASEIHSPEFGWRCRGLSLRDCRVESEYFLFESRDVQISGLRMSGKYSFQYVENMQIDQSELNTKDAFWHSKNVTVENSVIRGEYLGWYSENLTLKNCRIIGTQPLCYCRGLRLVNCTMEDTDLSFEYSDVEADIRGIVESVKNPRSGHIVADGYREIILEGAVMETDCKIEIRGREKEN